MLSEKEIAEIGIQLEGIIYRTFGNSEILVDFKKLLVDRAELQAEIDKLKPYADRCSDCAVVCAKTELTKMYNENAELQAEVGRLKQELKEAMAVPSKLKLAELMQGNNRLQAEVERLKEELEKGLGFTKGYHFSKLVGERNRLRAENAALERAIDEIHRAIRSAEICGRCDKIDSEECHICDLEGGYPAFDFDFGRFKDGEGE